MLVLHEGILSQRYSMSLRTRLGRSAWNGRDLKRARASASPSPSEDQLRTSRYLLAVHLPQFGTSVPRIDKQESADKEGHRTGRERGAARGQLHHQ